MTVRWRDECSGAGNRIVKVGQARGRDGSLELITHTVAPF
jgi:hypothetical protein